jgi:hypothetical protein
MIKHNLTCRAHQRLSTFPVSTHKRRKNTEGEWFCSGSAIFSQSYAHGTKVCHENWRGKRFAEVLQIKAWSGQLWMAGSTGITSNSGVKSAYAQWCIIWVPDNRSSIICRRRRPKSIAYSSSNARVRIRGCHRYIIARRRRCHKAVMSIDGSETKPRT